MHGRVHIQVGTLSKAIGALGGYVAGSRALIEFLHHKARPFLFSTSHPPSVTATCLAALDVLESDGSLIQRLWDNTRFFKAGLEALGLDTGRSESPITPVMVGDAALAMRLSDRLFELGVFAQGIGRTDFPRSDHAAMMRSLERVFADLPGDTRIHPGHGPWGVTLAEAEPWARMFM